MHKMLRHSSRSDKGCDCEEVTLLYIYSQGYMRQAFTALEIKTKNTNCYLTDIDGNISALTHANTVCHSHLWIWTIGNTMLFTRASS